MKSEYGSSPLVFVDENKRKEWEALPEAVRRDATKIMHRSLQQMKNEVALEMMANVIIDMSERIDKLEEKLAGQTEK